MTVKFIGPLLAPIGQEAANVVVILEGQAIVGSWVSTTVTVNMHISGPAPPFDLRVTVVVPTGKNIPEAGEQVTVPQAPPLVVGEKFTFAPHWFASFGWVMLDGHISTH